MKKKIFTYFISLSIIFFFLLSGCGGSQEAGKPAEQKPAAQQEQSQPAEAAVEETEAADMSNGSEEETQAEDPIEAEEPEEAVKPAEMPEMGDRLAKAFNDLMASGKYYMKYRMNVDGESIDAEIAYDDDNFATKTVTGGIKSHMIIKDQKMYMIDPDARTVMIMSSADFEEDEEDLDYSGLVFIQDGQGDFLGQTLPYEEYSEDGTLVKYFFKGKELVGMEMNIDGMIQVLEIFELSGNIPAGMFDIPKDYEQLNME